MGDIFSDSMFNAPPRKHEPKLCEFSTQDQDELRDAMMGKITKAKVTHGYTNTSVNRKNILDIVIKHGPINPDGVNNKLESKLSRGCVGKILKELYEADLVGREHALVGVVSYWYFAK